MEKSAYGGRVKGRNKEGFVEKDRQKGGNGAIWETGLEKGNERNGDGKGKVYRCKWRRKEGKVIKRREEARGRVEGK